MLVIELCGSPGCGKSYVLNELIKELDNRGYRVYKLNMGSKLKSRLQRKVKRTLRRWAVCSAPEIKKERELAIAYAKLNHADRSSMAFCYTLLYEMLKIKRINPKKYDIVLVGEGIVQSITSLSHGKRMDSNALELIRAIDTGFYSNYRTLLFLCHVDEDVNISRLKTRNKPGDRFLFSDDKEMADALRVKAENLKFVARRLSCVKKEELDLTVCEPAVRQILGSISKVRLA